MGVKRNVASHRLNADSAPDGRMYANTYHLQYTAPQQTSYTATFAPQPQPSVYSSTPILTQTIEDEPQVIKCAPFSAPVRRCLPTD